MTLSSSMRCSSKRDFRLQNHKRGHSFDSGLTIKLKEDDLLLFSDMQMRESENFLLNSSDDFDDSLAKLKYSSDFKLNIPVRGESNDLLNVGSEKNDYDWLLTPPETPLFSSLDDEDLASANLVSRGRSRAQPIPISTSSSTGKGHRAGRSSASPSWSSPSPRSGNKQPQLRGRPSSARSASPAVVLHPTTPSRRSTTPQNRPSTPTPRSSTPTHRRTSSGSSSSVASFGRTGTSPVKASRGNSASPKLREWQMSFPGLPSEPPPNLRTSLSDRSASHARDSSPLSRNGRKVSLKSSRQSISPTASRSVSSSQSNDRDHFSSRSKGSVTSSCDDDVDITYPVNVGFSSRPTLRNNGNFASSRNTTISKKPSRTITSDLAPKGSFSADHRHMDQCRTPHNMFRPLLSSVHHSSFHTTKSNTMHRPLFSWNSSLTTSSNASSDQGASVAPDTEGSDHDQNDLVVEWDTIPNAEVQDEIFKLDEADRTEDIGDKVNGVEPKTVPGEFDKRTERNTEVKEIGQQSYDLDDKSCGKPSSEFPCPVHDFSEVECTTALTVCSKYNESSQTFEISDVKVAICQKCIERHENVMDGTYTPGFPETVPHISQNLRHHQSVNAFISELSERSHLGSDVPQISEINNENFIGQLQKVEPDSKYSPDASPIEFCRDEKSEQNLRDELEFQNTGENFQQFNPFGSCQKSRVCSPEGAGISVLLERSSSSKGLVIQGRPLTAASVCCVEPSSIGNSVNISKSIPAWAGSTECSSVNVGLPWHTETQKQVSNSTANLCTPSEHGLGSQTTEIFPSESSCNLHGDMGCIDNKSLCSMNDVNALKVHVTQESFSAFLATDLGSLRRSEPYSPCQLDSLMNGRGYLTSKHGTNDSALLAASNNLPVNLATHMSRHEGIFDVSTERMQYEPHEEPLSVTEEQMEPLEKTKSFSTHSSATESTIPMGDECSCSESCKSATVPKLVSEAQCSPLEDVPVKVILNNDGHILLNTSTTQKDMTIDTWDPCPIKTCETSSSGVKDVSSQSMSNIVGSSCAHSVSPTSEKDKLVSGLESQNIDYDNDNYGESTIAVHGPGGSKSRSLTLEEARDSILFCSSIIHDLAFKAAAMAIEKEDSLSTQEINLPAVMLLGKSTSEERNKIRSRQTAKPKQTKRKSSEAEAMPPSAEPATSVKIPEEASSVVRPKPPNKLDSMKPPKLESKCNCTVM